MSNTPNTSSHKIRIKVCGMREAANIKAVSVLDVDYLGLICYEKSARYVGDVDIPPTDIPYVGVFVNATLSEVSEQAEQFNLAYIQLHGDESPSFCTRLKAAGFQIIKAFRVDSNFDFSATAEYESSCDFFLFDAKGKQYGGNGIAYDWDILQQYKGSTPFFLSGGINLEMIVKIKAFQHPQLHAIDVNSGFEIAPGLKNVSDLRKFIYALKSL